MTRLAWLAVLLLPLSSGCASYCWLSLGEKPRDPRLERIEDASLRGTTLRVVLRYRGRDSETRRMRLDVSGLLRDDDRPPPRRANEHTAGPLQVRLEQQYLIVRSRAGEHCTEVPTTLRNGKRTWFYVGKGVVLPLAFGVDVATFPFQLIALLIVLS